METSVNRGVSMLSPFFLASNSWSVWMETVYWDVLSTLGAVRLASNSWSVWMETDKARTLAPLPKRYMLASNSWSVWMETNDCNVLLFGNFNSCFQFVKRMNGNINKLASVFNCLGILLPIREAYEWKHPPRLDYSHGDIRRASNSWSVWMETFAMIWGLVSSNILLPIREAYEWKPIKPAPQAFPLP